MIHLEETGWRYERIYKLMEWKKYKEASDEAMTLIQESPEDAYAYAVFAQICLRMEKFKEAEHWSGEAIRRDPDNKIGWFVRTITYYETENWRAMKEALEVAQRIDPYEPYYFFLRFNIDNKNSRFAEAKEQLLTALELSPENPLFLAGLSYSEALLNNKEASVNLAKQALRLDVESDSVYLYLGWAAERRGDYNEQLVMLKNAVQLDPANKQIRDEYLICLQKSYTFYRILLAPFRLLKRLKPWQILAGWLIAWFLFKPLLLLFLLLYIFTHWITKLLVHVKVFGWRRKR